MAVPGTTRNVRLKNLAKATELKGNVLDMMKQTFDHCQALKETASIAVKILHARLLSEQERHNQQLQRHQTAQMQQSYDKYMQIANSWRCELRDIDVRLLQLQECMEQNVPQLRDALRTSNSTGDSSSKTTMVVKTDSKGTHKRDTPNKSGKLLIKKNRPRLATGGESSDPALTSTRETSSARSVKKSYRRLAEVAGAAGASASEVLPHRTRALNGWVVSNSRKKKATPTPKKHLVPSGKLTGKSARKTRFPKVESGHNTSLVSLTGTSGQGGTSPRHKTTPHPWPNIFKKTGKEGTDTSISRSNHHPRAPRTPTIGSDGSKTSIVTASKRSETTIKTILSKTSMSSDLHTADQPEDVATTGEGEVVATSSVPNVGELGSETAE